MIEHTRYGTGTADIKKDLRSRITELKGQAWDYERTEKYLSLIAVYRDLTGIQSALIAILAAENEDLANGQHELKLTE